MSDTGLIQRIEDKLFLEFALKLVVHVHERAAIACAARRPRIAAWRFDALSRWLEKGSTACPGFVLVRADVLEVVAYCFAFECAGNRNNQSMIVCKCTVEIFVVSGDDGFQGWPRLGEIVLTFFVAAKYATCSRCFCHTGVIENFAVEQNAFGCGIETGCQYGIFDFTTAHFEFR